MSTDDKKDTIKTKHISGVIIKSARDQNMRVDCNINATYWYTLNAYENEDPTKIIVYDSKNTTPSNRNSRR